MMHEYDVYTIKFKYSPFNLEFDIYFTVTNGHRNLRSKKNKFNIRFQLVQELAVAFK